MDDSRIGFYAKWLAVAGGLIVLLGAYIAFLNATPLYAPFGRIVDPVFWPVGLVTDGTMGFKQFIYGFSGAFLLVWGVQVLFVALNAFRKKERWAWWCLLVSTLVWFVVDQSVSLYHGVYMNALLNLPFLLLLLFPLLRTARAFNTRPVPATGRRQAEAKGA